MNYQEALDYLFSQLPMFQRIGQAAYKADLSNTIALCKALGNPERKFKSIHIAGTNGKGSVSHFLASILQSAGYKTGLFTSPHYLDFRERVKVNGQMISEDEVVEFVNANRQYFETIKPSFFEMSAGLAFQHFAKQKVDIAVIETGMGGRLDSTNVVMPVLSVITNIGKDHVQFLGDTLEKIAGEKAGIIKSHVPVVIGESNPETDEVFQQKAAETRSDIYFADKSFVLKSLGYQYTQRSLLEVEVIAGADNYSIQSTLIGDYQLKNIVTVLQAAELLRKQGWDISKESLLNGFKEVLTQTGMMGRWQVLSHQPLTICDAAHNAHGLKYVMQQLKNTPHQNLHMVFGTVNDKDVTDIIDLLPREATYYFCKSSVPRALDAGDLAKLAANKGIEGEVFTDVPSAIEAAQEQAQVNDLIFIGGSTFVVADALGYLQKEP